MGSMGLMLKVTDVEQKGEGRKGYKRGKQGKIFWMSTKRIGYRCVEEMCRCQ